MTSIDRRTALLQMGAIAGAALLAETVRGEGIAMGQTPAAGRTTDGAFHSAAAALRL